MVKYIANNKILSIVGFYILFSALLKIITGIDICIPCLWKTIFGYHCPGCGLTTAFISLIELNFEKALESNWLIFIILPLAVIYIVQDYLKFSRKHNTNLGNIPSADSEKTG